MRVERRYLIIPSDVVSTIDFKQVYETSIDTLRYSLDGTKTFVKYDIYIYDEDESITVPNIETGESEIVITSAGIYNRPSFYNADYQEYTHEEILIILATPEWTVSVEGQ